MAHRDKNLSKKIREDLKQDGYSWDLWQCPQCQGKEGSDVNQDSPYITAAHVVVTHVQQ